MQTIKTGVVVALLLAVCYGAFVALNAPETKLPDELANWDSPENDLESLMNIEIPTQVGSGSSSNDMTSLPQTTLPDAGFPSVSLPANLPNVSLPPSTAPATPSELGNAPSSLNPAVAPGAQPTSNSTAIPSAPEASPVQATTQAATTQAADGPAVKLPPLPAESTAPPSAENSLVVDSIPAQSKVSLTATEYPAIPLLDTQNGAAEKSAATAPTSIPPANAPAKVLAPFATARELALKQANGGDLKGALIALTEYYNSPELPSSEHADLLEILDALAREVIYSKRHLVMPAYVATAGETTGTVAAKHSVTPELIANINQLGESNVLIQDQQVKVVEGPFRGEVDLARSELTLFLKDMYAGRFPISVGTDPAPKAGHYEVADKREDRSYYGADNKVINANDPQNPYGGFWIDLGHHMCIHGTAEMQTTDLKSAGCISLSPIDAADVFIMVTQGSQIDIR